MKEKIQKKKEELAKIQEIKMRRKELRDQNLLLNDENESNIKRVKVEAIDFDWIFKGDNAGNFLKLLN
jgi:hypothetical protein